VRAERSRRERERNRRGNLLLEKVCDNGEAHGCIVVGRQWWRSFQKDLSLRALDLKVSHLRKGKKKRNEDLSVSFVLNENENDRIALFYLCWRKNKAH
jgi:hypothetical protein